MDQSIIFVHPNAGARALFHATALGKGYHVQTLASYPEALEIILHTPPELFVISPGAAAMPSNGYLVQVKQAAPRMKVLTLPPHEDIRESIRLFFEKAVGAERILIVDDEKECIDVLQQYLSRKGYTVITALSGKEAVAKVAAERPAVILLDIRMPDMDGITALKKIRETAPEAIVIMTTALGQESVVSEAVKQGAVSYLLKPFSLEKLDEIVAKQIKASRVTDA